MNSYSKKNLYILFYFFVVLLIGISIFKDYGISIDEDNRRINGFVSLKYIFEIFFPNSVSEISDFIDVPEMNNWEAQSGIIFDLPTAFIEYFFRIEEVRNIYLMRHLINFLIFFTSVYFFFLLIKRRYDSWIFGILGATLLLASPRIFSNSFFNNKDIVFMSLFIMSLYFAIIFLENPNIKNSILFSLFSALSFDVRIMGIILPFLIILFYIIKILRNKNFKKNSISPLILFIILTPIFIVIFWPYLWTDTLESFLNLFKNLSNKNMFVYNFYFGEYVSSQNLPWHYSIVWPFITTPISYLIFFTLGFFVILFRFIKRIMKIEKNDSNIDIWRGDKELQDLIYILTFLIPIFMVIDQNVVLYDGWRHLYFIYPSFLMIMLFGLNILKINFFKKRIKWFYIFSFVSILPIIFWMYKNHPHQNVYFNSLAGKEFNKKFDMDYWGLSNKTALEYIVASETDNNIKIAKIGSTDLYAGVNILKSEIVQKISIVRDIENADYIINTKRDWTGRTKIYDDKTPANFKLFHQIKVDGVSINTIYKKVENF